MHELIIFMSVGKWVFIINRYMFMNCRVVLFHIYLYLCA